MVKYYRKGSEIECIRQNRNFVTLANIQNCIYVVAIEKKFSLQRKNIVPPPIKIHAFLAVHKNILQANYFSW